MAPGRAGRPRSPSAQPRRSAYGPLVRPAVSVTAWPVSGQTWCGPSSRRGRRSSSIGEGQLGTGRLTLTQAWAHTRAPSCSKSTRPRCTVRRHEGESRPSGIHRKFGAFPDRVGRRGAGDQRAGQRVGSGGSPVPPRVCAASASIAPICEPWAAMSYRGPHRAPRVHGRDRRIGTEGQDHTGLLEHREGVHRGSSAISPAVARTSPPRHPRQRRRPAARWLPHPRPRVGGPGRGPPSPGAQADACAVAARQAPTVASAASKPASTESVAASPITWNPACAACRVQARDIGLRSAARRGRTRRGYPGASA